MSVATRRANDFGEAGIGVQAGADRRRALRQGEQPRQRRFDSGAPELDLRRPAGEFLAERDRRRVLEMRAADLDQIGEVGALGFQRVAEARQRRNQAAMDRQRGGNVHRAGKQIVRRLSEIDVVVGMDRRLVAASSAERFVGEVGDHLVHIHVRLRARTGLPDFEREFAVVFARRNLRRRGGDRLRQRPAQQTEFRIGQRGGMLDEAERVNDGARHEFFADRKVFQRALRLRAPQPVGGHIDRAETVGFDSRR